MRVSNKSRAPLSVFLRSNNSLMAIQASRQLILIVKTGHCKLTINGRFGGPGSALFSHIYLLIMKIYVEN